MEPLNHYVTGTNTQDVNSMAQFIALVELASHWIALYVEMKIKNRKTEDGFYHIATLRDSLAISIAV
jgi:hypothetical protein